MARKIEEFTIAWSALSDPERDIGGWQAIALQPASGVLIKAARQHPGNEESLLAGFLPDAIPSSSLSLPEGKGFRVTVTDAPFDGRTWIALSRKEGASPELFTEMVRDVVACLDGCTSLAQGQLVHVMLQRVRMWQHFMAKGGMTLDREKELGLAGELAFLLCLLDAGVEPDAVIEGWVGPEDAPQDFVLGTGAIEVKSSMSSAGFPARIGSLEQLDDKVASPLFLAAIRFAQTEAGQSVADLIDRVEQRLPGRQDLLDHFRLSLSRLGIRPSGERLSGRRFSLTGRMLYRVDDGFPRLTPALVPQGVTGCAYDIELTHQKQFEIGMKEALLNLGVLQ